MLGGGQKRLEQSRLGLLVGHRIDDGRMVSAKKLVAHRATTAENERGISAKKKYSSELWVFEYVNNL